MRTAASPPALQSCQAAKAAAHSKSPCCRCRSFLGCHSAYQASRTWSCCASRPGWLFTVFFHVGLVVDACGFGGGCWACLPPGVRGGDPCTWLLHCCAPDCAGWLLQAPSYSRTCPPTGTQTGSHRQLCKRSRRRWEAGGARWQVSLRQARPCSQVAAPPAPLPHVPAGWRAALLPKVPVLQAPQGPPLPSVPGATCRDTGRPRQRNVASPRPWSLPCVCTVAWCAHGAAGGVPMAPAACGCCRAALMRSSPLAPPAPAVQQEPPPPAPALYKCSDASCAWTTTAPGRPGGGGGGMMQRPRLNMRRQGRGAGRRLAMALAHSAYPAPATFTCPAARPPPPRARSLLVSTLAAASGTATTAISCC